MQASFVDIGQEKAAFLYVADVYNLHRDLSLSSRTLRPRCKKARAFAPSAPIEERLEEGQHVLVQVAKDPIGTKGARVTSHVSLPGRYLVYMPTVDHVGISRRIEDEGGAPPPASDIVEAHPTLQGPASSFAPRARGSPDRYLQNDMRDVDRALARHPRASATASSRPRSCTPSRT
jgi:Rne/Rng family ribonuclease